MPSDDTVTLTDAEFEALSVVSLGLTSVSTRTRCEPNEWVRCINGRVARRLKQLLLIRDVAGWPAVEITPAGRDMLAGVRR